MWSHPFLLGDHPPVALDSSLVEAIIQEIEQLLNATAKKKRLPVFVYGHRW
jgi:hypothetical protein